MIRGVLIRADGETEDLGQIQAGIRLESWADPAFRAEAVHADAAQNVIWYLQDAPRDPAPTR